MLFTSKEIACAACVSDHLQFLQDVRRHRLPIESRRFNGRNTYDLTSFAVSMVVGELRDYGMSLSSCGRLLSRVDLEGLSKKAEQLALGHVDDLIVLIPQRTDNDDEFETVVSDWSELCQAGWDENANFISVSIGKLLIAKLAGQW